MFELVGVLPEILFLIYFIFLTFFLSVLRNQKNSKFIDLIFLLMPVAVMATALILSSYNTQSLYLDGLLRTDEFTAPTRIFILFISSVLIYFARNSTYLVKEIRYEFFYFIQTLSLLSLVLLLSNNLLLTFMCIIFMSCIASLLAALPLKRFCEVQTSYMYWQVNLVCVALCFIVLLIFSVYINDFSYSSLASFFRQADGNAFVILSVLSIAPFLISASIFPFHNIGIDKEHSTIWPGQATVTVLLNSIVVIAIIKYSINVIAASNNVKSEIVLNFISMIGFFGAFVGVLAALTQKNIKRLLSFLSIALWSICLIPLFASVTGTMESISSLHLLFSISLMILFIVFSYIYREDEVCSDKKLNRLGLKRFWIGMPVLASFFTISFFPPFSGFSAIISVIHTLYFKKSIMVLVAFLVLVCLLLLNVLRLINILFFAKENNEIELVDYYPNSTYYKISLILLIIPLLFLSYLGKIFQLQIYN